jgi:hypothetical protein
MQRLRVGLGKWTFRTLRMMLASSLVLAAFGAVAVRVNIARAADVGMGFGDQLLAVGEHGAMNLSGDVYHVHFNGQTLHSTNTTTHLPMHDVLTYAATQCKEHARGLRDTFQHIDQSLRDLQPTTGDAGALILHREYSTRGFVFCAAPDHALTLSELMHRLQKASRSGDFSRVGDVRYMAVEARGGVSHVVTAWTEGSFRWREMFPPEGDVPGEDFGGVPRPDGSRRMLSASVDGAPAGVNSYLAKGRPDEVLAHLETKLFSQGWKTVAMPAAVPAVGRAYTLGSQTDLVVTAKDATQGMTNVGYVVSRSIASVSR